ncbi:hypothetical protein PUR71_29420 [Streptomyces sp. SP17BM10]|uniref:hypothetical protein n=1 Tax=Streptomyces sp. SP17BM10 TaxID=3002530 RepID=UPI002E7AADC6|nr:hypothetical protein [Streptomyces sp. SP17BM10]MEE1786994.1 hypothetical protein [Streptomyces sp. SP17BM10]
MVRSLLVIPLLAAALGGLWLARGAHQRWRDLRAAQVYELAGDRWPMLLRAAGAMVCGVCVTALTLLTAFGAFGGMNRTDDESAERAEPAVDAPAASGAQGAGPRQQAVPPTAEAAVAQAAAATSPAAVPSRFDSVGHPGGGELLQSAVLGPDGKPRNVRVWLPPQYAKEPNARFPVVVMQAATPRKTADAEVPDVFEGIGSALQTGKARPFILVAPEAPNGTAHPCDLVAAAPQAVADDVALRTTIAATFRAMPPGPASWGTLGVEGGAPCAAAAGLARPDLYGAAAAVSGRYDAAALTQAGAEAPAGTAAKLMLAAAKADAAGLDAARKLQAALHGGAGPAAKADVRISDNVQDFTPDRERLRLVRQAAQYLADTLGKAS